MNIYLMEITYVDVITLQPVTLRYCSGDMGYTTLPTDTPANAWYEPRVKIPSDYACSVFKDGVTGGSAAGAASAAQLLNADGFFDQFMTEAFDGHQIRILWGDAGTPVSPGSYANFQVLLTGTMCQPTYTYKYFEPTIRDYTELFDKPLSQVVYLGNNVTGVGIEGTPSDYMGKTKPMCMGHCLNVTPAWISTAGLIYQVHNGQIQAVDAVYTNGQALTLDTSVGTAGDCATLTALQAATPGAGKYCTCLAGGLFKIAGAAGTTITADVRGDATGGVYVNTVAGIIQRIAQSYTQYPRTNIALYSETYGNAAWTYTGLSLGSSDSTTPITGMATGIITESGSSTHNVVQNLTTPTSMYCYSRFVKPGTRTTFRLKLVDHGNSANYCSADFDLSAGTYSNVVASGSAVGPNYTATGFITAAGVIAYPNGWYRIWVAGQPNSVLTSVDFVLAGLSSGVETYTGSSTFSVGGAMVEAYSSPHIYTGPTTASSVTGYDPLIGPTLNTASFTALASFVPYDVGYYVGPGETTTAAQVMNALCACGGCFWSFDRSGSMFVGQFVKPSSGATPVATFTTTQILQDTIDRSAPFSNKDGTPAYRVSINCQKNWTTFQQANIASSLWTTNPTLVAWLSQEWRTARAEDLNYLYFHPLACELQLTTYLASMAEATTEVNRLLALYKGQLDRFTFTVKLDQCPLTVMVGSIINLTLPRWNLSSGRNFVVIGITEKHETGQITLEVLG